MSGCLRTGALGAKIAPCPVCRSRMFPSRPTPSYASAPRLQANHCRSIYARGSSKRRTSRHWTRYSIEPVAVPAVEFLCRPQLPLFGPIVIVVDASVLAVALADDGPDGDNARSRLRSERLAAPELVDLEVASVLRRQLRHGDIDDRRASQALTDLIDLPLRRASHKPLLARCWELRGNLTVYDAAYVALAEVLDATLLTGDGRMSRATGPRCRIETLRSIT
jgi:predicted nucleic acid-binding protein